MIGKVELRRAFEHKPFVTKGYVMKQMGYKRYEQVDPFFIGLDRLGRLYLTEEVIERILEIKAYGKAWEIEG